MSTYFIKVSHIKARIILWLILITFTSLQAQNTQKEVYSFTFKNADLTDIVKVIEKNLLSVIKKEKMQLLFIR